MSDPINHKPHTSSLADGALNFQALSPAPPELVDFEILKLIGVGTFGQVWLAKERVTGVYRAIKTFPKTADTTEISGLCEFQRRALQHPHLIQILLVGQQDGFYYVVMELADDIKGSVALDPAYYEPCSLERIIQDRGAMPLADVLQHVYNMLAALDYLHRKGLVHRDIKPSNILFVNNQIKLCDFGLLTPGHQAVVRAGTHGYWQPGGPSDRNSDLYAMTKVTYKMITGFPVERFPELTSDFARINSESAYRQMLELLERGCSEKTGRRFASAEAMLKHIEIMYQPGSGLTSRNGEPAPVSVGQRSAKNWINMLWAMVLLFVIGYGLFQAFQPAETPFMPQAEMIVTLFPDHAGNPNSLSMNDPQEQMKEISRVISTNQLSPQAPERDVRFAKLQLIAEPSAYMAVFWISPSGYVDIGHSKTDRRSFFDPELREFRRLDGQGGNYVICALLNDRPFRDLSGIREEIERLVSMRVRPTLPLHTMRILSADKRTPILVQREDKPADFQDDFGLLGEIRRHFGNSYPIVGIELPLSSD